MKKLKSVKIKTKNPKVSRVKFIKNEKLREGCDKVCKMKTQKHRIIFSKE